MRRAITFSISLPLLTAFSWLHAQDDSLMKAMRDELARSMEELQLEALERPYFIAYRVAEITSVRVSGTLGSLLTRSENHTRTLAVEARVGDYALDNTNFLFLPGRRSGVVSLFRPVRLPLEDDYKELRRQIWLATDGAYKQALEDLSQKRAALQNKTRSEEVPDFSQEETTRVTDDRAPAEVDLAEAEKLVRDLSALFKEMPAVFTSRVQLEVLNVHTRYINSEGTSFTRTTPLVTFTALAGTQAPDGMALADFVAGYGRSPDDLLEKDELAREIRELGVRLRKLRNAELVDRYNGPVLFEGQAAAELFNQIFAPKLLALRLPISDDPRFGRVTARLQNPFLDKLGARVLPEFLSVVDNPTLTQHQKIQLVSGYKVDDDGVPGRETKIIEKGILNMLLATRKPVPGITHSTGNRRGSGPMPSNLVVIAEDGLRNEEMKEELLRLVKVRGKDYGIIVRRIGNPLLKVPGAGPTSVFGPPGGGPTRVEGAILAYKVFPDGREELIRNAELLGITEATFKDIVAASKTQTGYSAPFMPRSASPFTFPLSFGFPIISLVVPSLLFEDVSIKKPTGVIPRPPVASRPFFDK